MIFRLNDFIRFVCLTLSVLFVSLAVSAQENAYDSLWRKVAAFEEKGLVRSAWEQADKIYRQAKEQQNRPQQIKALIYQLKYREQLEEAADVKNIPALEQAAATAVQPARSVLQSMLAELYWDYLRDHRFTLYSGAAVPAADSSLAGRDARSLQQEISRRYRLSLQEEQTLKNTSLAAFGDIILEGKHTAALWPTLYDLLAHRALDYYTNDESGLTEPADYFEITDAAAFAPAREFAAARFDTGDSASLAFQAVKLLQDLLRFHLDDRHPGALIDADLERLSYMYRKSVREDKDSLYEGALRELMTRYPDEPAAAQAAYLLAQLYYEQGQQYEAVKNPVHRLEIRKAKDICEKTGARFPASEGGLHCRQLLRTILQPAVVLQTENVNLPQQPFRCLVTYKNTGRIYLRVVRLPDAAAREMNRQPEEWKDLLQYPAYKHWQQALPDPADYREHAAEVKIASLPAGYYALLASGDSAFSRKNNPLSVQYLHVSLISYIHDEKGNYFVLDRESGRPLEGAGVQAWEYRYDYAIRKNVLKKAGHYTTNGEGYFRITPSREYRNLRLEFSYKGEYLLTGDAQQVYPLSPPERDTAHRQTFLFTDRSVYRPGQTLFFKGIMLQSDRVSGKSSVLQDQPTLVYLQDMQGHIVDSLQLKTNSFGSYAGSFRLPEGALNGQLYLRDTLTEGRAYFAVEEYKRPRFEVDLTTPAGAYRLGDTVSIAGTARSYAGSQVDGAVVSFRVVRRARFPYPWLTRIKGPWSSPQREIASGTLKTDAQGHFSIRFPAIPDRQVSPALEPVFTYEATAEVTDINGETQTGAATVPVGYEALTLDIPAEGKILLDSLQKIRITAANLSGIAVTVPATLKVYRLQEPGRFIRERYWQEPDQFVMSREAYLSAFPADEYQNESDPATWERSLVAEMQIKTGEKVQLPALSAAWYALEATATDTFGTAVKTVRYVQAYGADLQQLPFRAPLWTAPIDTEARPGEKGYFLLGTADSNAFLIRQVSSRGKEDRFSSLHPGRGVERVQAPVEETDRGGILYNYFRVKNNRFYTQSVYVKVPWSNKELQITYGTFRDKLLPGSKEHWKIRISGAGGDRVAAELLAAMYDASLDVFRAHKWPDLDLYPSQPQRMSWSGADNFAFSTGSGYFLPGERPDLRYEKIYPALNWFGYNHGGRYYPLDAAVTVGYGNAGKGRMAAVPMAKRELASAARQKTPGPVSEGAARPAAAGIPVRENLSETAFFFPQLQTGPDGEVMLNFTMPEALTRWKLMMLAHTRDLAYAFSEKEVVTQKPLMILPNAPRFLREGDTLFFAARITSLYKKALRGMARLQLLDAATLSPLNGWVKEAAEPFGLPAEGSAAVQWRIQVPSSFTGAVLYRVSASAGDFSDGEQAAVPVLTNRAFITETLPLAMTGSGSKSFTFRPLLKARSDSRRDYGLTVEFSSNPAWYAVQALPYLTEGSDACSEQLFDRYYATALAGAVIASAPGLQDIFRQWQVTDTAALESKLQKNEALKTALLNETPWVLAAETETARQHRVAELFEAETLEQRQQAALEALAAVQTSNGGFAWFSGMPDDRFITQYIMSGIGHLLQLKAVTPAAEPVLRRIAGRGISYLDQRLLEDYRARQKQERDSAGERPGSLQIQYLYMRSFFPDIHMDTAVRPAYAYYDRQARESWTEQPRYLQGMIALAQYRAGNTALAKTILRSLQETAIRDETGGMYWKDNRWGYAWYQAPVETQSLLIEAFKEIGGAKAGDDMASLKAWLLQQKQTQHWPGTKATAEAVYALLLSGADWLQERPSVNIRLGDTVIRSVAQRQEAGTGYFRQFISGTRVTPSMGDISLEVSGAKPGSPSWGGIYWQYFEDMEKVTAASSPLAVSRELFLQRNTPQGPVLLPLREQELKPGDKIKVRILLRSSRDMDYVQVKDLRASCLEPVQVRDGYRWQNGLGYYQVTGDLSMRFFIDHLRKGAYVLEYTAFVAQAGSFNNGLCTAQSMYAPEFASHTGGGSLEIMNDE